MAHETGIQRILEEQTPAALTKHIALCASCMSRNLDAKHNLSRFVERPEPIAEAVMIPVLQ